MKQFKLFSLVALVLSLTVSAAFAETGKMESTAVASMCDRQIAELNKHEAAVASIPAHQSSAPVKEETPNATNAM